MLTAAEPVVAIHQPDGVPILFTANRSRKMARRGYAADRGMKWGDLWKMGYRCRMLGAAPPMVSHFGRR